MKPTLYSTLSKALKHLENKKMMIPKYCDQSKNWLGKNHYSLDMIPEIQKQIDETKAAIKGIEEWRKEKRKNPAK
jgi:hypothetical protein